MVEFTSELIMKIDDNIEKIFDWFIENANRNGTVYVEYNYDSRVGKYKSRILVTPDKVETGNLWGCNTNYCDIRSIKLYKKMDILKQWEDIKENFLINKENEIEKDNNTISMIMNFTV